MTLLRQHADSRKELRERLDTIQKNRAPEDTRRDLERSSKNHEQFVVGHEQVEQKLHASMHAEHITVRADRELNEAATVLKRLGARWKTYQAYRRAKTLAPVHSDKIGDAEHRTG